MKVSIVNVSQKKAESLLAKIAGKTFYSVKFKEITPITQFDSVQIVKWPDATIIATSGDLKNLRPLSMPTTIEEANHHSKLQLDFLKKWNPGHPALS